MAYTSDRILSLQRMNAEIIDIYEVLATLTGKISSLEQAIYEQSVEISRLNRIINQKDKRIHALEKENKKLMEGLSHYEKPDKDSHNSSIAGYNTRYQPEPGFYRAPHV